MDPIRVHHILREASEDMEDLKEILDRDDPYEFIDWDDIKHEFKDLRGAAGLNRLLDVSKRPSTNRVGVWPNRNQHVALISSTDRPLASCAQQRLHRSFLFQTVHTVSRLSVRALPNFAMYSPSIWHGGHRTFTEILRCVGKSPS